MAWVIIADQVTPEDEGNDVGRGQWGTPEDTGPPPPLADLPYRARLYDDDGELHYVVAFDAAAYDEDEDWGGLYQCWEWGMSWSGATDLRTRYQMRERWAFKPEAATPSLYA